MTDKELIDAAKKARESAYCPYSHMAVGAALLAASGKVYFGANIENASFTPTVCAERVAFFSALMAGERDFIRIAVVCCQKNLTTRSKYCIGDLLHAEIERFNSFYRSVENTCVADHVGIREV